MIGVDVFSKQTPVKRANGHLSIVPAVIRSNQRVEIICSAFDKAAHNSHRDVHNRQRKRFCSEIMKRKILLVSSDAVRMNVNSLWTTAK